MKKWVWCAVLATLAVQAFAQEEKRAFDRAQNRSVEQKVAFERPAFPFEGEVSAERLNVRMFPKSDPSGVIASILGMGEKVTVVGEKDEFFQILPTRGCTAWIFARSVKREGAAGTVSSPEAPVRTDSRVNAEALATLREGDAVKIVSEHMGWYKIESPAAVKYFVAKKYIRPGKALEIATDEKAAKKETAKAPAATGWTRLPEVNALLDEQRKLVDAGRLEEVDFGSVVAACDEARNNATDPAVKADAERAYARYREIHLVWTTAKARKAELEAQARAIEEAGKPKPPEKKEWAMTGYVDTTGSTLFKRPGTHKLVVGGKIVAFLRAKDGDPAMVTRLNDLYEKYVGVNGVVIKDPEGWPGYSVIVIDEIVPLMK